ncbi:hypothetical protein Xaut_3661 [Xanthobacter versatilis]|uniref:Uncharacterized protein n=1 Tax=Xanthobacter autotrophicus (strain ATCC BAA-1158 / Py2) TaxID=78245 RepID=A7ILJ6_XANP2|nr:hypothetical protein Xaut_3661 [Xanthobacter autotrophicus Py2]
MGSLIASYASGAVNWLLVFLTGSALIVGVGGMIYSRLPVLPYRTIVAAVSGVLLFVAGWTGHAVDQRGKMERQALLEANRKLVVEITAERHKAESLEADRATAQRQATEAEDRARKAEEVAVSIPDSGGVSQPTSDKIRDLWGK